MTRLCIAAACLLSVLVACDAPAELPDAGPALDAGSAQPARRWFRDGDGAALVLRGSNVEGASKWTADFLPESFSTRADFGRLRTHLGMNVVRFLVLWEAIEPTRGSYDAAYLAEVRARIDAAGEAGLRVLVDMHQDVFGRGFGGDGAPRWACDEALYESFEPPDEWFQGYFEPEVGECFDRLFGEPAMRAAYGSAWAALAEALAGSDAVFAYELMNEPFWGSSDLRQFETQVAPLAYTEWTDAIRAVDPTPLVIVGPASAANVGLPSALLAPERERLGYAPHIYPASVEQGQPWSGDQGAIDRFTALIWADAERMDLPVIVTELGGRGDVPGVLDFLTQSYDALDDAMLSVTQWEAGHSSESGYGLFDEDGAPNAMARAIARPYPARTAGTPTEFSWDGSSGVFTLEWDEAPDVGGDTRVPLPRLAFPDGADVTIEDGGAHRVEDDAVYVPSRGRGAGRRLTVSRR